MKRGWEVYERRERKGREVGVLKRVGNRGKRGEHDYPTILKFSQTTRAKSRKGRKPRKKSGEAGIYGTGVNLMWPILRNLINSFGQNLKTETKHCAQSLSSKHKM